MELDHIGGTYGGNLKPVAFIQLVLKVRLSPPCISLSPPLSLFSARSLPFFLSLSLPTFPSQKLASNVPHPFLNPEATRPPFPTS